MVLAEIPDNLIFIIVMLVIAAFKALAEKFGNKNHEDTYSPEDAEPDYDYVEEYEEYQRQIEQQKREILARQQGREEAPPPLPPVTETAPKVVIHKPSPTPYQPPVVQKPKLSSAEQQALANLKSKPASSHRRKRSGYASTARARARRVLASPHAARDAIVLSEILGQPKGQRM